MNKMSVNKTGVATSSAQQQNSAPDPEFVERCREVIDKLVDEGVVGASGEKLAELLNVDSSVFYDNEELERECGYTPFTREWGAVLMFVYDLIDLVELLLEKKELRILL
jgi:hypothetical protein